MTHRYVRDTHVLMHTHTHTCARLYTDEGRDENDAFINQGLPKTENHQEGLLSQPEQPTLPAP